jgi:hypothetical protein
MKNLLAVLLSMSIGVALAETAPAAPHKTEAKKEAPAKKDDAKPEIKHHKKAEGTEVPTAPTKK